MILCLVLSIKKSQHLIFKNKILKISIRLIYCGSYHLPAYLEHSSHKSLLIICFQTRLKTIFNIKYLLLKYDYLKHIKQTSNETFISE